MNRTEIYKFKHLDNIPAYQFCLGDASKDFTNDELRTKICNFNFLDNIPTYQFCLGYVSKDFRNDELNVVK